MGSVEVILPNVCVSAFIILHFLVLFCANAATYDLCGRKAKECRCSCFSCAHPGRITHLTARQNHAKMHMAPELSIDFYSPLPSRMHCQNDLRRRHPVGQFGLYFGSTFEFMRATFEFHTRCGCIYELAGQGGFVGSTSFQ